MSSIAEIYYGQTTGTASSASVTSSASTTLTASDGESFLYQSQKQLVNSLSSTSTSLEEDIFSPSFLYNAVTTPAVAQVYPEGFKISADEAEALGEQIKSNTMTQLLASSTPLSSDGIDILGSIYAATGALTYLAAKPTSTFQFEA